MYGMSKRELPPLCYLLCSTRGISCVVRSHRNLLLVLKVQNMLRSSTLNIQRITRVRPRIQSLQRMLCSARTPFGFQHDNTTHQYNWKTELRSVFLAVAGGFLGCSVVSSGMLLCEEPLVQTKVMDEEDPYANLPEEDEETDCTICKTFRQGPCRLSWRKLERCFKDNEGSEAAASACTQYFMGHQECLSGFTNLYQLISLELKQELIDETEKAVLEKERLCWSREASDSFIDWSQWRSFCKDMGKSFRESLAEAVKAPIVESNSAPVPLWKKVLPNEEPLLVATVAKIPTQQDGMLLKFAYAVDQNGLALGVAYHEYYGKILEQHKVAADSSASSKADATSETETAADFEDLPTLEKDVTLEFYILPEDTRLVQLCAFYTEDPAKSDESKKLLDVQLYKTQKYQLRKQC